jgi:uncharacterized protein YjdB
MKNFLYTSMILAVVILFTACKEKDSVITNPVTGIVIENAEDSVIKVKKGASFETKVALIPANAGNAQEFRLQYASGDTTIFSVDPAGVINGLYGGEAMLTVLPSNAALSMAQTCRVVVEQDVTGLNVPELFSLGERGTRSLSDEIEIVPDNATYRTLSYRSADESIVTVDANGWVSARKQGNTTIVVATTDGTHISETINVEVLPYVEVTSLTANTLPIFSPILTSLIRITKHLKW